MKVLIACEFSGRVRDAFLRRGHDAISCDLLPSEKEGPHYQGDVRDILEDDWDLMIAHPPCTYLARSGAQHWNEWNRETQREAALDFIEVLLFAPIRRVALENPPGAIGSNIQKASQYIHPYQFGHPYKKKTGLWLRNLPFLKPTNIVEPMASYAHTEVRLQRDRSRTFPGIAEAMADQWGGF